VPIFSGYDNIVELLAGLTYTTARFTRPLAQPYSSMDELAFRSASESLSGAGLSKPGGIGGWRKRHGKWHVIRPLAVGFRLGRWDEWSDEDDEKERERGRAPMRWEVSRQPKEVKWWRAKRVKGIEFRKG
jgi:hypothetical protein